MTIDAPVISLARDEPSSGQVPVAPRDGGALIIIPCCARKIVVPAGEVEAPLPGILVMRERVLEQIRRMDAIATRPKNRAGVLASTPPIVMALDLYSRGNFYSEVNQELRFIAAGNYPGVHLLILSALYGLVKPREGLKNYDLEMSDKLADGRPVYRFWKDADIDRVLEAYIADNCITRVWSLLPDSIPRFPYHQTLGRYWRRAADACVTINHVKIPGAGSNAGRARAKWLKNLLHTDSNQLLP